MKAGRQEALLKTVIITIMYKFSFLNKQRGRGLAERCGFFSKIRRKPSPVGRGYKAGREALYSIAVWLSIYVFNVSSVAPPAVQAK